LGAHLETPRACFAENTMCPELPQALFGKRTVYRHRQHFDSNTLNRWGVWEAASLFPSLTSVQFPHPKGVCEAANVVIPRGKCWSRAGHTTQGFQKHPCNQITSPVSQDVTSLSRIPLFPV